MIEPVPNKEMKSRKIGGVHVQHLGSLNTHSILLVVGRSNYRKKSTQINDIATQLHSSDLSVVWYESKAVQHARLRDEELAAIDSSWLQLFSESHRNLGYIVRKLIRLYLKIKYPKRHYYIFKKIEITPSYSNTDLQMFIRRLGIERVFILAHSAGGIIASSIESESAIKKTICFGYPFKHPEKPDEDYRTCQLKSLTKPYLIIQGHEDEYGSASDAQKYEFSDMVRIESIYSNHDCDNLSQLDCDNITMMIAAFLD